MGNDPLKSQAHLIELPAPTVWPMVLALGFALLFAGMVTNIAVGILGLLLIVRGAFGWFREVLPNEMHASVKVDTAEVRIVSSRTMLDRLPQSQDHRKILPFASFKLVTGIKGGVAGGIAMTLPAALFGLIKYHSIWYAANLLAAGGFVSWADASTAFLSAFHWQGLLAALLIHGFTSLLVGLLYGAVLPMFPRFPILSAGILVPLFFTGLLYSVIGVVSPILDQRIDWFWFVVSQIAFGLVCGFVVNLHDKVRTKQFRALPFAQRAGIHGDRIDSPDDGGRKSKQKDSAP